MLKAAIAVVHGGMEIPKPNQIKAYLELASVDVYKEAKEYEVEIYERMVKKVQNVRYCILIVNL